MTQGKYVLITGATSGIGYELAKLFAEDQHDLIIIGRHQHTLDEKAQEFRQHGVEVITIVKDLFNKEAGREIYNEVKSKGLDVDILVNDAGMGEFGKFVENDLEKELAIVQLNICSVLSLTKPFARDMVARGSGRILNLSSIAGKIPGPYHAVYHGTKAFIDSFTAALHSELKETGVSVTALLPGVTDTDFFRKAHMESSKIVDQDKADPAKVAKDGYKALMNGEASVISGFKNKFQVAESNILSDEKMADMLGEQQKPKYQE